MSDRRVPRYEDDYSAELPRPAGAAPLGPSGAPPSSGFAVPRARGEITGAATADCRLPTAGKTVSSRGDPALPAAPSVRPQPGGAAFCSDAAALVPPARREEAGAPSVAPIRHAPAFALSEQSRLLALLVAERGGIAVGEVIERAVVHYAEHIIGIAALARPMILPHDRGESLGADAQAPP